MIWSVAVSWATNARTMATVAWSAGAPAVRRVGVAVIGSPTYEDERYDPPRIAVDIDDPYARWVADADWAAANSVAGQSQVDAYQKDGLYVAGSATFFEEGALFTDPPGVPVQGTFEIRCADAE